MSASVRLRSFLARVLSLALVAAFAPTSVAADSRKASHKLDQLLADALKSGVAGPQSVIIQIRPGALYAVRDRLEAHRHGDVVEKRHAGIDSLVASVTTADLESLADDDEVIAVSSNTAVSAFAQTAEWAGETAGVLRKTLGLTSSSPTGKGIGIAIIDSGIQPSRDFEGRIVAFYDFVNKGGRPSAAYDDFGHGTHVAGLIGSSGALGAEYKGVAPGARLIGMKVLDAHGVGTTSGVIDAILFATLNKKLLGIDIINLSLGHPIYEAAATDPLVRAVEVAVRAGIIVVVAAGNVGVNPATGETGFAGITSPGNARSAITVGAFDDRGSISRRDDHLARFSSRGPTWYDGYAKPDLVAPGHRLVSDSHRGATLYKDFAAIRVDANHIRLSGTSMAAAVVAGAAAVVLEANRTANLYPLRPSLRPNGVRAILEYTALNLVDEFGSPYHPLEQGAGGVNLAGAVEVASRIYTAAPVGAWWLRVGVNAFSTIAGETWPWAQKIIWSPYVLKGLSVFAHEAAWDDIIWGILADVDIIWGNFIADDIVWGTFADDIVWGTHVVWGPDLIGARIEDDIIWGTSGILDDIVWGTLNVDDIVWGTLNVDDIVWGTLNLGDSIVWGTRVG